MDAHLLAVDKPPGLLSVPGRGADLAECLHSRLTQIWPGTLLVHRLDRDTSGVMIFARSAMAQRHLGLQFERRHLSKTYVALVHGTLPARSGLVDLPLIADWPNRPRQMVDHARGKAARTGWEVGGPAPSGMTRVSLYPESGRSHQLRVHMAELGCPIVGDPLYGPENGADAARLMLHASGLELRHPDGGKTLRLTSPVGF